MYVYCITQGVYVWNSKSEEGITKHNVWITFDDWENRRLNLIYYLLPITFHCNLMSIIYYGERRDKGVWEVETPPQTPKIRCFFCFIA